MKSTESRKAIKDVPYPRVYYQLAATGCVGIAAVAGAFSVYLYLFKGNWLAGVGMVVVGLLWAVIGIITNQLRRAHHGY